MTLMTLNHFKAEPSGKDCEIWLQDTQFSTDEQKLYYGLQQHFGEFVQEAERIVINWRRTFEIVHLNVDDYVFDSLKQGSVSVLREHWFERNRRKPTPLRSPDFVRFLEFTAAPARLPQPFEIVTCRQSIPVVRAWKVWSRQYNIANSKPLVPAYPWIVNLQEVLTLGSQARTILDIRSAHTHFRDTWRSKKSFATVSYADVTRLA